MAVGYSCRCTPPCFIGNLALLCYSVTQIKNLRARRARRPCAAFYAGAERRASNIFASRTMASQCLDAPAFHRNHTAIGKVLKRLLGDRTGDVIEIGSGTGQHVVTFAAALPDLTWWPSDPNPSHRASIEAWRAERDLFNVRPAIDLDAAAPDWRLDQAGRPPGRDIDVLLAINVLHITPWAVSLGLLSGAARHLKAGGLLVVYGPFARDGAPIAPSNAAFDAHLRQQNGQWGVRDIADLKAEALENGLELAEIIDMPANNNTLIFEQASSSKPVFSG